MEIADLGPDEHIIKYRKTADRVVKTYIYGNKKRCTKCHNAIPVAEFHTKVLETGELASACSICANPRVKNRDINADYNDKGHRIYKLDGKEFGRSEFIRYVHEEYGVNTGTVSNRLKRGWDERRCTYYPEETFEQGSEQKPFRAIDQITGEIMEFPGITCYEADKKWDKSTITRGLKTGLPTRPRYNAKYKNPVKFELIKE